MAAQNNRTMAATTVSTSAPHFNFRSSSVISDGTNSNGTLQTQHLASIFLFCEILHTVKTLCVCVRHRLCVCGQRDIWWLQRRRHPQRDSQTKSLAVRRGRALVHYCSYYLDTRTAQCCTRRRVWRWTNEKYRQRGWWWKLPECVTWRLFCIDSWLSVCVDCFKSRRILKVNINILLKVMAC